MPTPQQISKWKEERLATVRATVGSFEVVAAAAVTSAILASGHTLDDEETERRWVFNKHGELIGTRTKKLIHLSKHPWIPGLRQRVDTA